MTSAYVSGSARTISYADVVRRIGDVVGSSILLLVALPVLLVAVVGSAVALRAWPLFTQERIGRHAETFRFLKVRTLPVHIPKYTDKHQLERDTIPAFCRVLRRLHLDELPQLLLVLRGHMSLVGPRPEMAHLHEQMPRSFAVERTAVRPGCTGLWQVSEACTELIGATPEYDRFYLENRTLRLDAWVLLQTAAKMTGLITGVRLDDVPAWTGARPEATVVIDLTAEARSGEAARQIPASVAS